MMSPPAMVFVIDDDQSVRKSLARLLDAAHYKAEVFKDASDFILRSAYAGPSCVIVDVKMPGLNGIAFQEALIEHGREEQLIFITAHGDIPMCAQAMKAGAVDFRASEKERAIALLNRLTRREYEVMQLVATGLLNKQVGSELGMAEKTVKTHRAHVMQKLGITSVAELMVVLQKAGVTPVRPGTKV